MSCHLIETKPFEESLKIAKQFLIDEIEEEKDTNDTDILEEIKCDLHWIKRTLNLMHYKNLDEILTTNNFDELLSQYEEEITYQSISAILARVISKLKFKKSTIEINIDLIQKHVHFD